MDKELLSFFGAAKKVSLKNEEKNAVRTFLVGHVKKHPVKVAAAHCKTESYLASAQDVSLTQEEKTSSFDCIYQFMRSHPLKQNAQSSFFEKFAHFFAFHRLVAAMLVIGLFASSGGAVAYAAEDSLPGDLLYSVKTEITEPLLDRLQFTPERRARWALRRLERRMDESTRLAGMKRLTSEHQEKLAGRIEKRMTHLENRIEALESDEVAEPVRERLEQMLEHHEELLQKFESGDIERQDVRQILHQVRGARENMARRKRLDQLPPRERENLLEGRRRQIDKRMEQLLPKRRERLGQRRELLRDRVQVDRIRRDRN